MSEANDNLPLLLLISTSRKKKSKSKSKDKEIEAESSRSKGLEKLLEEEERKSSSPGPSTSKPVLASDRKTAAEKRFEETQKRRVRHNIDIVHFPLSNLLRSAGREGCADGNQDPQRQGQ